MLDDRGHHKEFARQWAMIVARAWSDTDFRLHLIDDPNRVLDELGVDRKGISVNVIVDTPDICNFVLPLKPEEDLSERDLEQFWPPFFKLCSVM